MINSAQKFSTIEPVRGQIPILNVRYQNNGTPPWKKYFLMPWMSKAKEFYLTLLRGNPYLWLMAFWNMKRCFTSLGGLADILHCQEMRDKAFLVVRWVSRELGLGVTRWILNLINIQCDTRGTVPWKLWKLSSMYVGYINHIICLDKITEIMIREQQLRKDWVNYNNNRRKPREPLKFLPFNIILDYTSRKLKEGYQIGQQLNILYSSDDDVPRSVIKTDLQMTNTIKKRS